MPSSYSAMLLKNAEAFSEGHEQHWLLRQQARASFPSVLYCKKHHREISWSSLLSLRLELEGPKICTGCSYGYIKIMWPNLLIQHIEHTYHIWLNKCFPKESGHFCCNCEKHFSISSYSYRINE